MVKIVVDSGCDLTQDLTNNGVCAVAVAPLTLQLGDVCFTDDETLDVGGYIAQMATCPTVPKTAAPSPESYLAHFQGAESVFAVTLSSHLSTSYNCAMVAKEMYAEEHGGKFIHVVDSLSASVGEMLVAREIVACATRGMADADTARHVTDFVTNMRTYFILERYTNTVKNGRMNPYVAKIATALSLMPICWADGGKMCVLDKARGFTRAIAKLADIIAKDGANLAGKTLAISHVQAPEKAAAFKALMAARFPFQDIVIVEASGLCATYADKGGIIIAF